MPASTVNRWETGDRNPGAIGEALLALIVDNPRRAERVLRQRAEVRDSATTAKATGERLADRVLAQVAKLELGPRGAKSALLTELRRAMRRVKRTDLDAALLELEREGRLALGRAVRRSELTAADRRAAIGVRSRGLLALRDPDRPVARTAGEQDERTSYPAHSRVGWASLCGVRQAVRLNPSARRHLFSGPNE